MMDEKLLTAVTKGAIISLLTFLLGSVGWLVKESYDLNPAIKKESNDLLVAMQVYNRSLENDKKVVYRILDITQELNVRSRPIGGLLSQIQASTDEKSVRDLIVSSHRDATERLATVNGMAETASVTTLPMIKWLSDNLMKEKEVWEAAHHYVVERQKNRHGKSIEKRVKAFESSVAALNTTTLSTIASAIGNTDRVMERQANNEDQFKARAAILDSQISRLNSVANTALVIYVVLCVFFVMLWFFWKTSLKAQPRIISPQV